MQVSGNAAHVCGTAALKNASVLHPDETVMSQLFTVLMCEAAPTMERDLCVGLQDIMRGE